MARPWWARRSARAPGLPSLCAAVAGCAVAAALLAGAARSAEREVAAPAEPPPAVDSERLYLSGAGVANASFGLPDLGMTSLNDVCEDVRRIAGATTLPLLVDADTGWGQAFMIARTVRDLTRAGAAGGHRAGHGPRRQVHGTW